MKNYKNMLGMFGMVLVFGVLSGCATVSGHFTVKESKGNGVYIGQATGDSAYAIASYSPSSISFDIESTTIKQASEKQLGSYDNYSEARLAEADAKEKGYYNTRISSERVVVGRSDSFSDSSSDAQYGAGTSDGYYGASGSAKSDSLAMSASRQYATRQVLYGTYTTTVAAKKVTYHNDNSGAYSTSQILKDAKKKNAVAKAGTWGINIGLVGISIGGLIWLFQDWL